MICIVDEDHNMFFGYVYPLSHVAVNSIHVNANVWSVYRFDKDNYCELVLRSRLTSKSRMICCCCTYLSFLQDHVLPSARWYIPYVNWLLRMTVKEPRKKKMNWGVCHWVLVVGIADERYSWPYEKY